MYVTDTHPFIWYLVEAYRKLSPTVRHIFDEAIIYRRTAIVVPVAVLWEISLNMKPNPGNIQLALPYSDVFEQIFQVPTLIEEPVTRRIVARSHDLKFHTDPFDALIVATALEKDLPLITNDLLIHDKRPCELVWD